MTSPPSIRSFGAATTVTGSCHLLETDGARVLVDCGYFQGSDELYALNHERFGFAPSSIDALLLTHAHLDHSGRIPQLVNAGYDGPIYCLKATGLLIEELLLDAAKLQREEVERAKRRNRPVERPAIFDEDDVRVTLERVKEISYHQAIEIAGMSVTPYVAGHIPGSASFLVETGGRRIVFSGDIGNARKDVLPDPDPCPEADEVFIESTYGDRDHRDFDATIAELTAVLKEAHRRRGKILIPSFALERTQDVLYHIARLEESGAIEPMPVYVDSPLADRVEDVYNACQAELSEEVLAYYKRGIDPFVPRRLTYTQSVEDSKAINASRDPAIVIAGSGMMTGGRILHHLKAHLDDTHTTVLIVGFQPHGGLGRQLVDGAKEVRIMGEEVRVNANVITVGGLSAHAGRSELLAWAKSAGPTAHFRCVHGEPTSLQALAEGLIAQGHTAEIQPSEIPLPNHGRKDEGGE